MSMLNIIIFSGILTWVIRKLFHMYKYRHHTDLKKTVVIVKETVFLDDKYK